MARLETRPFNEGLVVVVGASGAGQDPHEVAVVAQVLQQAGHPPVQRWGRQHVSAWTSQREAWGLSGESFNSSENLRFACKLCVIMGKKLGKGLVLRHHTRFNPSH